MKRAILNLTNSFLSPFGAKIVRKGSDAVDMSSAVQRISEHDISINSVIDIGASNGKWSMGAMKIFPRASYLAIEPLTEREDALKKLKEKYNNFDYVLCVAGDTDGQQVMLNVADDLDGSTIDGTGGKIRRVPVKTVDVIVSEMRLEAPFLLKFDTHGYEIPILNGAKDTLAKTNIIMMEVYNFKITKHALRFHEMCLHMEKLGFRCYDIAASMLRLYDKAFWQMDILFCRSNSRMFSYQQYE
ncbi:MAG: FkbM family methyltransferase [Pseudomonadota bacterium]